MSLISLKNIKLFTLLCTFICIIPCIIHAQETILINKDSFPLKIGNRIEILIDSTNQLSESTILTQPGFKKSKKLMQVIFMPENNIWVRFKIKNLAEEENLFIGLQYSNIEELWLYDTDSTKKLNLLQHTGNALPFETRKNTDVDFNFNIKVPRYEEKTYYFKFRNQHPLELAVSIGDISSQSSSYLTQALIIFFYSGIILSMLLYNLFLYASTKDRSYFMYVLYLLFLFVAQLAFSGWAFKYLWSSHPGINTYSVIWTSCLAGIFAIIFAKSFLNTAVFTPKLNKLLLVIIGFYIVIAIICFTGDLYKAYNLFNFNSLLGGFVLLLISVIIIRKGFRPAFFYFIAWSAFLSGIIMTALRNLGVVPTNDFTRAVLYIGSAIEVILLSIALADRINILQKEKTLSQAEALKVSLENEKLIKEQNIVLEQKVDERTEELQHANHQLNDALTNLKDAQTQLVDAEKIASLGQLTAGIAHEINNPINFVKSNIKPLQLDFNDLEELLTEYNKLHGADDKTIKSQLANIASFQKQIDLPFVKTEIVSLIKGIEEGAERTAEIVRGLRTFSRLDEGELKTVSIHEGIDSTLVLLKNSLPYNITIVKDFKADGNIDCYPGKLNQVFMNIINNGIQAIQAKPVMEEKETVTIATADTANGRIVISIKDSGIGMSEEVKQKIFEPFFTTKPVGEGTGLGMAIAFKIIETHKGKIDIISSPGNGSEFILSLPHTLSETSQNPR